jgi:hypothetical protein
MISLSKPTASCSIPRKKSAVASAVREPVDLSDWPGRPPGRLANDVAVSDYAGELRNLSAQHAHQHERVASLEVGILYEDRPHMLLFRPRIDVRDGGQHYNRYVRFRNAGDEMEIPDEPNASQMLHQQRSR